MTVCLPTYNRKGLLSEALTALEEAIGSSGYSESIEVIVADNCSSDGTFDFLTQYARTTKIVHFRTIKHESNLGADVNMASLADEALGDYCWLVSDDDLILAAGFRLLMKALSSGEALAYYVLNIASWPSKDGKQGDTIFKWDHGARSNSLNVFSSKVGTYVTFMSIIAFKRKEGYRTRYAGYVGSNLYQAYIFIDAATSPAQGMFLSEPVIALRPDNTGGYSFIRVFVANYLNLFSYARTRGLSFSAYYAALAKHLTGFALSFIVRCRLEGRIGRMQINRFEAVKEVGAILSQNYLFTPQLLLMGGVLLAPRWLLKVGKKARLCVKTALH